jgi:tRNA (adenine22-N1)-methyltransferase
MLSKKLWKVRGIKNKKGEFIRLKIKLTQRLLALAAMVPTGSRVADIGTDHALLPCFLIEEKKAALVIGTDLHQGPFERARQTVWEKGLEAYIELRLGDGLTVIRPGEVDTVVIAGMGGTAMRKILAEAPEVVGRLQKLILQPMTNPETLRFWLQEQGWVIDQEDLVYEDKQYYQIIGAVPLSPGNTVHCPFPCGKDVARFQELAPYYGPLLIQNRHPLLAGLLSRDLEGMQMTLEQLAKATQKEARLRYKEYAQRTEKIMELKQWLSVVNPSSI